MKPDWRALFYRILLALTLLLAFFAYRQPTFMLELANRWFFCG